MHLNKVSWWFASLSVINIRLSSEHVQMLTYVLQQKFYTESQSSSNFQCKQFSTIDISLLQPNCSAFANFQLIRKRDKADSLGFSYYAKEKPKQTSFIVENIYSYIADAMSQILTSASTWDPYQLIVYTGYIWLEPHPGVSKHIYYFILFCGRPSLKHCT